MKENKKEKFDYINKLYIEYINEQNPFRQRKIKDEIKAKVSPYELL